MKDLRPGIHGTRPRTRTHVALLLVSAVITFATVLMLSRRSETTLFQASRTGLVGHRVVKVPTVMREEPVDLAGPAAPIPGSGVSVPSLSSRRTASVLLYAASYDGTVTTLNLDVGNGSSGQSDEADPDAAGASPQSRAYSLDVLSTSDGCKESPSWLTLDASKSILYCADEGVTSENGSVSSFSVADDGSLDLLDRIDLIKGPVSSTIYGHDGDGLAVAQYGGSSFTSLNVTDASSISEIKAETFSLAQPGAVPDRQDAPHPHEAVLDPTGRFILVPDLGADLVRVFSVDPDTLALTSLDDSSLEVEPGSGPRHLAFLKAGSDGDGGGSKRSSDSYLMYLVSEIANTVTGYKVSYEGDGLKFDKVYESSAFGKDERAPEGSAVSEIVISPDGKFVIISSRSDKSFTIPDPDTGSGDQGTAEEKEKRASEIPSDSIITFSVDSDSGDLTLVQKAAAGGLGPRHFSINKEGDVLAVGLQQDGRVAMLARDTKSGKVGDVVASKMIGGEVTSVIFAE